MTETEYSVRRTIVILLVAASLLGILGVIAVESLRPRLASRYIDRGISYLKVQNYDRARAEFLKAERSRSSEADEWLERTEIAKVDPLALEAYWIEWKAEPIQNRLAEARGPFAGPKEALTKAIALYNSGDYSFAQYAVEEALKLDPEYPEAWHYKYLICTELASEAARYRDLAEEARIKRDSLTSLYLNP